MHKVSWSSASARGTEMTWHACRDPATERQLDDAERLLQVKLPPCLRVIYRLHNGQDLSCDDRFPDLSLYDSMFHGLLGG